MTFTPPPHTMQRLDTTRAMTDPTDADSITGAHLRALREAFGMSAKDLADFLACSLRVVQRWEATTAPAWAVVELDTLTNDSLAWLEKLDQHSGTVPMWRDGFHISQDGRQLPASWWRMLVGHAMLTNPELVPEWVEP
ncbi:helix-turn-helix domain-containing protein [Corynebacterium hindlerae]|uniref:Helix-turn-helix domain-containing protein n=1 Tax=Corynebacterium hindlerae TaxID=699041 RepID=A0A7G5FBU0_9CORY|nr:helix-turn-helix transcriptional regulator [Corynebacterium hindlerae]QMV84081.1 helix-turn-helix domain-containing protein [Corynebacterium hindlerae]